MSSPNGALCHPVHKRKEKKEQVDVLPHLSTLLVVYIIITRNVLNVSPKDLSSMHPSQDSFNEGCKYSDTCLAFAPEKGM